VQWDLSWLQARCSMLDMTSLNANAIICEIQVLAVFSQYSQATLADGFQIASLHLYHEQPSYDLVSPPLLCNSRALWLKRWMKSNHWPLLLASLFSIWLVNRIQPRIQPSYCSHCYLWKYVVPSMAPTWTMECQKYLQLMVYISCQSEQQFFMFLFKWFLELLSFLLIDMLVLQNGFGLC